MKDATPLRVIATRREFCTHACHAAAAVAVGSVLQGCGGGGGGGNPSGPGGGIPSSTPLTVVNGSVTGGGVTVPVDGGSPLASVGGAALVRSPAADVLVYRSAQDAFQAVTATCTHEACTITGIRNQTYVCPCHGSQFTTAGSVVSGPATRSLRTHNTSLSGATLTIAL
jgi:cytochrome b6-f complex iron-sulfur subunit